MNISSHYLWSDNTCVPYLGYITDLSFSPSRLNHYTTSAPILPQENPSFQSRRWVDLASNTQPTLIVTNAYCVISRLYFIGGCQRYRVGRLKYSAEKAPQICN